ncbi:MAG: hypothetical protein AAF598_04405, partial [Bacteroidota bacterium]
MEQLNIQTLDFGSMHIAATVDTQSHSEHSFYHPSSIIYYMLEGHFNMKLGTEKFLFPEKTFFLVRKFTRGTAYKTWGVHRTGARMIAFIIQDELLQKVIDNIQMDAVHEAQAINELVVSLPETPLLLGLINSLNDYFSVNGKTELNEAWVLQKTEEALMAIVDANPDLVPIFTDFASPEKADLVEFINHNFMFNLKLSQFAKMSGRSLSSFNREFRRIFHET